VKTSSVCSRSAMRPEYLAEFEAAGLDPHAGAAVERPIIAQESAARARPLRTTKVILSQPAPQITSAEVAGVVCDVFKLIWYLLLVSLSPLIIAVWIASVVAGGSRAGRRRRRRRF
jgi:hypothetical protein